MGATSLEISTRSSEPRQADEPFEAAVPRLVTEIRSGCIDAFDDIALRPDSASSLSRSLGLQLGLGWKIWQVLTEDDPFVAAQHVPGRPGFKLFFKALTGAGATPTTVADLDEIAESFEYAVQQHGGDRSTFDMMLASNARSADSRAELNHRRTAFRGNSFTFGLRCDAAFTRFIVAPSSHDPSRCDIVGTHGFINLTRLRADVPWRMSRGSTLMSSGRSQSPRHAEPLFTDSSTDHTRVIPELPLLVDYCSTPLPEFRRILGRSERIGYELAPGQVGAQGGITCLVGEIFRAVYPRFASEEDSLSSFRMPLKTPAETAVFELIAHQDVLGGRTPMLDVVCDVYEEVALVEKLQSDRLPTYDPLEDLGPPHRARPSKAIPKYAELTVRTFERAGWSPDDFTVFRIEMRYPPIASSAFLSFPLPTPQEEP
ncbi:MAG: hypothetical protein AAGI30_04965 [Planctomycetota bacterium]